MKLEVEELKRVGDEDKQEIKALRKLREEDRLKLEKHEADIEFLMQGIAALQQAWPSRHVQGTPQYDAHAPQLSQSNAGEPNGDALLSQHTEPRDEEMVGC